MSERLVYLILGSRGGGRASVVADLIDFGLEREAESQLFVSETDVDAWGRLPAVRHERCGQSTYAWNGVESGLDLEASAKTVFVVADGLSDPADFVESFFSWLGGSGYELGRILTVADCLSIHGESKLLQWYDCCIHFSDVVLLNNRHGVSNKWVEEFKDRYRKEYYPCLFEFVKKGRVANPSLVLEPEARRISKLFDEADEWVFVDEEGEEEEPDEEEDEPDAGDPDRDPFLRKLVNGKREKVLPDVGTLLPAG